MEDGGSKLLDEITTSMSSSGRMKGIRDPFMGGLPQLTDPARDRTNPSRESISDPARGRTNPSRESQASSIMSTSPRSFNSHPKTSNHELMSLMMARLSQLEQKVQFQTKELAEKDKKVRILEDKLRILKKARESDSPSKIRDLEKKCLLLQQQLHEMEQFLADYGMMWVGEEVDDDTDVYNDLDVCSTSNDSITDRPTTWRPGNSMPADGELKLNFNQVVQNIKELNILAGEGVAKIQHTTDGARLKMPDSIPMVLYANGVVLFNGPFRPYSDPSTRQCMTDLMEGYFPSELQARYPDGVPFQVTDKRNVFFKDKRHEDIFTGSGQILGGEIKPSRLVPSNLSKHTNTEALLEESDLPGPKISVDQFLSHLPSSVVKGDKVIDIRNSLKTSLQGSSTSDVTVVETDVVHQLKKRLDVDRKSRPATPRDITTLRIKEEKGDRTYILKMKFLETVGDLRTYLDSHRAYGFSAYEVMSTFPSRVLEDNSATLLSCGLTPNATLHLRAKNK